ncbi:MAG: carboxypeptidase-like regulatory domain-containing protein [Dysgonomonas sp.]|mgnify:CR=1 FL=1|nr:carboxypeptidase-like regulatory domain-containing protein [Dysgonomonas sp.]
MRKKLKYIFYLVQSCLIFLLITAFTVQDKDILSSRIETTQRKGTVYQLLREISERINYEFIYDSNIINNEKKTKISKGQHTLIEAIHEITDNKKIQLRVLGRHILLYIPQNTKPAIIRKNITPDTIPDQNFIIIEGLLSDRISNEPIAYGTIGVSNSSIGTISNLSGEFKLIIPDSLQNDVIRISHLGYQTQEICASLLDQQKITIALNPVVISLQEIIIRKINPHEVLDEVLDKREQNYQTQPFNTTAFYREGAQYKTKNTRLAEAVLQLYKTGIQNDVTYDHAKLLKMRIVNKKNDKDTVVIKMKSGIYSILQLDIMKNIPEFILPENRVFYNYVHTDITVIDGRQVNVIAFEPKESIKEPLFKGEIYVDAENSALIKAYFEIPPRYIKKVTSQFIEKRAKGINISPEKISYQVTYKPSNGKYYVNHIRGDLFFRVKKRLFSSSQHMWFEMVNCDIDSVHVKKISRTDRLPSHNIFSETRFTYDPNFWGNFNTILPEEKLKELIIQYFSEQKK